jgi:hypothetical protein
VQWHAEEHATLPAELGREEFGDEVFVIGAKLGEIGAIVTLGVEVVGIELLDPGKHLAVPFVGKVPVGVFSVPGIEGVVTDHVEGGFGEIIFDHVIEVFVVSPAHEHIVESAFLLVDPGLRLILGNLLIRVLVEEFREDDGIGIGASDGKSIADDSPLWFAVEAEDFTEVVDEAGEDEPSWVSIGADLLGGLDEVLELALEPAATAAGKERKQVAAGSG